MSEYVSPLLSQCLCLVLSVPLSPLVSVSLPGCHISVPCHQCLCLVSLQCLCHLLSQGLCPMLSVSLSPVITVSLSPVVSFFVPCGHSVSVLCWKRVLPGMCTWAASWAVCICCQAPACCSMWHLPVERAVLPHILAMDTLVAAVISAQAEARASTWLELVSPTPTEDALFHLSVFMPRGLVIYTHRN